MSRAATWWTAWGLAVATAGCAALLFAGVAHGSLLSQCAGENIEDQGSNLQIWAQREWQLGFNTSTNAAACNGTQGTKGKPEVRTKNNLDSGVGLNSWGVEFPTTEYPDYGALNAFIATDEPPNEHDKEEIELREETTTPETLETIPVLQEAIAVIVHLPEGCVATSKWEAGRLVLNDSTLVGIFDGTIKKWSEITDDGDELSGAGCNAASAIKPVARTDRAGTTRIFKRFLDLIENRFTAEGPGNTTWPEAAGVLRSGAITGSSDPEVTKVAETPGSIGYSALRAAREEGAFSSPERGGGPGTSRFWVGVQRNGPEAGTPKYADPSSNGDSAGLAEANCAKTEFTNGEAPFPPRNVAEPWNEVVAAAIQAKYPICGLSYVLAFKRYGAYFGTSLAEATTVHDYVGYVLNAKAGGGQALIKTGQDYLPLPKGVLLEEAQEGAAEIEF